MSDKQTYPNAGPNCDLSKYRTGETPMVGDVVRWHGHIFSDDMGTVDPPTGTMVVRVGPDGELFFNHRYHGGAWWYAYRFDLISRADSPDAGKVVEPTVSALLAVPETSVSTFNHQSIDAREWAAEFCRLFPGHDEGLMLGWFANAIMAGYDEAMRRTRQPQPTTADAAVKDSLTVPPAPEPTLLEAAERLAPWVSAAMVEGCGEWQEACSEFLAAVERAKGGG